MKLLKNWVFNIEIFGELVTCISDVQTLYVEKVEQETVKHRDWTDKKIVQTFVDGVSILTDKGVLDIRLILTQEVEKGTLNIKNIYETVYSTNINEEFLPAKRIEEMIEVQCDTDNFLNAYPVESFVFSCNRKV